MFCSSARRHAGVGSGIVLFLVIFLVLDDAIQKENENDYEKENEATIRSEPQEFTRGPAGSCAR